MGRAWRARRVGEAVRAPELRRGAGGGDRGGTGDVRTTPVAPQAGTPQPPDHPRPGIGRGGVRRPGNPFHGRELEQVTQEWRTLAARAGRIARRLPDSARDAWFELVGYEVEATANLYELREAEFTNLLYAAQGRAATNDLAAAAEAALERDFALAERFNHDVAGGKWAGFQTQPHIDYGDVARYGPNASWQQPELNSVALPDVLFLAVRRIELPPGAELGWRSTVPRARRRC